MVMTSIGVAGDRARALADVLARRDTFAIAAAAATLPELVVDAAFPTSITVLEEGPDRESTHARVAIAKSLGSRVVLVLARPESQRVAWGADVVVFGSCDEEQLADLAETEERDEEWEQDRMPARRPPRRTFSERERQALLIWERTASIGAIAEEMGVTHATASTFLWRARRKLKAGFVL